MTFILGEPKNKSRPLHSEQNRFLVVSLEQTTCDKWRGGGSKLKKVTEIIKINKKVTVLGSVTLFTEIRFVPMVVQGGLKGRDDQGSCSAKPFQLPRWQGSRP